MTDKELDILYQNIEFYIQIGGFSNIDDFFNDDIGNVYNLCSSYLIGLLTATLPIKSKLKNRELFYNKVEKLFELRHPKTYFSLLGGLK